MTTLVSALELLSEHACFGSMQHFYQHASTVIGLSMRFLVYLPPQTLAGTSYPALFYLAGLMCTGETFAIKVGTQRVAAREELILIGPDTSPRNTNTSGETNSWDFGITAGFYLDTIQAPWREHYRMEGRTADELHHIAHVVFLVAAGYVGIFGHSVDGHGALTPALHHRERFTSVSMFASIVHPSVYPWGIKAFIRYLRDGCTVWAAHDATQSVQQTLYPLSRGILVDQSEAGKFLAKQLYLDGFVAACAAAGQPLQLCRHLGYDHGYYFIETFIEDHLLYHAVQLR